jgi:hypothetical protein
MVRRALIRAEALLLVFMLVATPLALLARPSLYPRSKCNGMCCRPQKSHSAPAPPASSASLEEGMFCHRGTAGHLAMCIAPSSPHEDRDAFAPLPPAILLEQEAMDGPRLHDEKLWRLADSARTGFAPIPFEPPRS